MNQHIPNRTLLSLAISAALTGFMGMHASAATVTYNGSDADYAQLPVDSQGKRSVLPGTDLSGNTVTITDTDNLSAAGTYKPPHNVYGGVSDTDADVTDNRITMKGGTIGNQIIGGYTASGSGNITGNSITLSGGTAGNSVIGGYTDSGSGDITGNRVTIAGGTISNNITGGYSYAGSGDIIGNSVTIAGDAVASDIQGGYNNSGTAKVSDNVVTVSGGSVKDVFGGKIFRGTGNLSDNVVTVSGGTVRDIYGGQRDYMGMVSGNSVTVSGGTVTGNIFGGHFSGGTGMVNGNHVAVSGGTVGGSVYGGYSSSGSGYASSVTGNSVDISGGAVSGDVYGGYKSSSRVDTTVTDNTVTLKGGSITGGVYGGYAPSTLTDYFTGNTLNVANSTDSTISVSNVQNFETLSFDLSNLSATTAALTSTGNVTLGSSSLGKTSTINIAGVSDTSATGAAVISAGAPLSDTFSQTVAGMSTADFITYSVKTEGSKMLLDYILTWVSNDADQAHGTFTLTNADSTFTLGGSLSDNDNVSGTNSTGWNGKDLTKAGDGTLILTGKNTYTGSTTVSAGTLKLGTENAIASTSGVTVSDGATLNLGGNSQTVTTLNNRGTVLINDSGDGTLTHIVTLYGDIINSGTLVINNCTTCAGQTLAVAGNWTGDGGMVTLSTVLGGDDSLTDKLTISGSATGTTYVAISNEGGTGAQTLEGIEVITTGSSSSESFIQKGRIVAGSDEYHLQQGTTSGANMNNWYLTSQGTYRPERGSYTANLQAAATMFNTRLKDRQGNGAYTDPVTGESTASSLWARAVGGHTEGRISDGQSSYKANRMVFQVGGDILSGSLRTEDEWHLGIMGGYGKQSSSTLNGLSGYRSKGSVWGYSTGLYGTWHQDAKDNTGLYVDSWILYNWFDNSVKGDALAYEKYASKGLTASLESGYQFHVGSYLTRNGMENNVYVTPQAQVLWSGVKAGGHTEANGTKVEGNGTDNVQTRLGVRLSMTGQSLSDKGSVRQFEPFVEANWLYTAKNYGVKMGDSSAYLEGNRNVAEFKTGVMGRVSENLNVWGNVTQQLGADNYQDTQGMIGMKYVF